MVTKEIAERLERPWWRWLVLFVVSLVMFGSYYVYDALSPLNEYIQQGMGIDNEDFGKLFTFYSIPNLFFLLVVAGFLLDKIGVKRAGTLYAFLILLGSALTSLGAGSSFALMLTGRAIFGFGSEATLLVTNKVIARWFKGKELGFAFGLNITVMRLGTILALRASAPIADAAGSYRWAIWVSTIIMLVAFLSFLVYLLIDRKSAAADAGGSEEKIVFSDMFRLGYPFWIISFLCLTYYSAVFPFTSHAIRFLQMKWGMTAAQGGAYTSYIMTASMIFTPLLGLLVDKRGHRGKIMVIGSLLILPAHLLLGLTRVHPVYSFIMLGISFSLVPAALWPAIPILIKEEFLGTAYGIIGWIQNMGLALFPWLAGRLVDAAGGSDYTNMEIMFSTLSLAGLIFSILLMYFNRKHMTGLELPSSEAQSIADQQRAAEREART
jgi:MFS family permease